MARNGFYSKCLTVLGSNLSILKYLTLCSILMFEEMFFQECNHFLQNWESSRLYLYQIHYFVHINDYMGQGIQEWTKIAFKKPEVISSAVFHKFSLVQFWIPWPKLYYCFKISLMFMKIDIQSKRLTWFKIQNKGLRMTPNIETSDLAK